MSCACVCECVCVSVRAKARALLYLFSLPFAFRLCACAHVGAPKKTTTETINKEGTNAAVRDSSAASLRLATCPLFPLPLNRWWWHNARGA